MVHTPPQLRSCYRIWESTLGDSKQCENFFDLSSALLSRLPLTVYFYHMSSSFSYISCSFLGLKHFAPLIKLGFPLRRPNKFGSPRRADHFKHCFYKEFSLRASGKKKRRSICSRSEAPRPRSKQRHIAAVSQLSTSFNSKISQFHCWLHPCCSIAIFH